MRKTSEAPFPYGYPGRICYVEKSAAGLHQIIGRSGIREAVARARQGACTIYAAWPGQHRTDLFEVDDIEALAEAVGMKREAAA